MAAKSLLLKFRISPSLSHKLTLYAGLKEIPITEAAQEALSDWFETIGAARLECAIDREIAETQALTNRVLSCADDLTREQPVN
jgi:hypothetical protein